MKQRKHRLRFFIVLLSFSLCQSQSSHKCCKTNQQRQRLSGWNSFLGFLTDDYHECVPCAAQTYFKRNYDVCPLSWQVGSDGEDSQTCQRCPYFTVPNSIEAPNFQIIKDHGPHAYDDVGIRCFTRCFDAYQTLQQNMFTKDDYEIYEDMNDEELREVKQIQLFPAFGQCQTVSQLSDFHFERTENGDKHQHFFSIQ